MRFKFLAVIALAGFIGLSGCKTESNVNANKANTNTAASPTPTAAASTVDKAKIEEALTKAGFKEVTVDTTTSPATLRGTVAKGKTQEMIKVVTDAAGKPLQNATTEK